jgi:hypothetical protein
MVSSADASLLDIEGEIAITQRLAGARLPASQQRAYPGQQLLERERLDDVVIRATVKALDPILHFVLGSQEEDGRVTGGTQAAANFETVHAGHENIENDQVWLEGAGSAERRRARGCRLDRVAFEGERSLDQARDLRVVVDDEDVGAHPAAV